MRRVTQYIVYPRVGRCTGGSDPQRLRQAAELQISAVSPQSVVRQSLAGALSFGACLSEIAS